MKTKIEIKTLGLLVSFAIFLCAERQSDKRRVPETELSDSEDEGDNRRDKQSYRRREGERPVRAARLRKPEEPPVEDVMEEEGRQEDMDID